MTSLPTNYLAVVHSQMNKTHRRYHLKPSNLNCTKYHFSQLIKSSHGSTLNCQQSSTDGNFFNRHHPYNQLFNDKQCSPRLRQLENFTLFPELPKELRLEIWALAAMPKALQVSPESVSCKKATCNHDYHTSLLFICEAGSDTTVYLAKVCHESRDEVLRRLPVGFPSHNGLIRFDPTFTEIAFKGFQTDQILEYKSCNGNPLLILSRLQKVTLDMTFYNSYRHDRSGLTVYYRFWKYFLGSFPDLKIFTLLAVQPGSTAVHSEGARDLLANTTIKSDLELSRKKLSEDNEAFKNLEWRVYEARKALDTKTGIIYTKLKKVENADV